MSLSAERIEQERVKYIADIKKRYAYEPELFGDHKFVRAIDYERFLVWLAAIEAQETPYKLCSECLKNAAHDYDSADEDGEFNPPHPIFRLAEENDRLRGKAQEITLPEPKEHKLSAYCEGCGTKGECYVKSFTPKEVKLLLEQQGFKVVTK